MTCSMEDSGLVICTPEEKLNEIKALTSSKINFQKIENYSLNQDINSTESHSIISRVVNSTECLSKQVGYNFITENENSPEAELWLDKMVNVWCYHAFHVQVSIFLTTQETFSKVIDKINHKNLLSVVQYENHIKEMLDKIDLLMLEREKIKVRSY
ncbi:hypothetical protein HZS_4012 [Henneguya salminicola]|nr:hypothetical protein HZS_4012 [Henneguya salminicola]